MGVQGSWGVVPAHLNELSPTSVRGSFPGIVYNLGNLISSPVPQLLSYTAESFDSLPNYALAQSIFISCVAVALILLTFFGPEKKEADFASLSSPTDQLLLPTTDDFLSEELEIKTE